MGPPHPRFYAPGADLREAPVLRLYGVTEGGSSCAAFVHGFEPYFYVEAPTPSFSPDDCAALAGELNVRAACGVVVAVVEGVVAAAADALLAVLPAAAAAAAAAADALLALLAACSCGAAGSKPPRQAMPALQPAM